MNYKTLQRRDLGRLVLAGALLFGAAVAFVQPARAADESPDALVKRLSTDVLETIKADKTIKAGDVNKIMQLVDSKIMPNVNFQRMTASAVGPAWRQATPEQQKHLQDEFKTLLVRTYAGALDQVTDQTVTVRPFRPRPTTRKCWFAPRSRAAATRCSSTTASRRPPARAPAGRSTT
jgi:phospholipid transport system substrate-binding protein